MRMPAALVSALAYSLGRDHAAPVAPAEPTPIPPRPVVEPWRPSGIPDEPDPIAEFIFQALKPDWQTMTPVEAALDAYATWARLRGLPEPDRVLVRDRMHRYAARGSYYDPHSALRGFALRTPYAPAAHPIPLRAIPGLRARVLADSALLCAELLAVLQSSRSVLEAVTDEPGTVGEVVRLVAAMLDDALADAACSAS